MKCPSESELAAGAARDHVATCERCRALVAADAQVASLGAALPWRDSPESRVEEMRAELLASAALAARPSRSRLRPIVLAAVAAAAAVVFVLARGGGGDPPLAFHGTISPHAGATWLRASSRPDEIVRLLTGTITVDVSPLAFGERFRVVTGDAEVEVKGTSFEVVADHDHLIAVRVWSGHVRVAPRGGPEVLLAAGGTWTPPAITAQAAPASLVVPPLVAPPTVSRSAHVASAPRGRAVEPPVSPRVPNPAESSYEAAWQALRGGDYATAAGGFARTATLASPLAEDASFWRGVALARAFRTHTGGTSVPARDAFVAFLDRFPHSPRAGEASAMLGWLLVEAGDPGAAAVRFHAAEDDPVDSVRVSARRGLEAIPHSSQGPALPDRAAPPKGGAEIK